MERIAACVILLLAVLEGALQRRPRCRVPEESQALDNFQSHFRMFPVLRRFQRRHQNGEHDLRARSEPRARAAAARTSWLKSFCMASASAAFTAGSTEASLWTRGRSGSSKDAFHLVEDRLDWARIVDRDVKTLKGVDDLKSDVLVEICLQTLGQHRDHFGCRRCVRGLQQ